MERKISVERLYSLEQYQNIKFTSELNNIPESVALNEEAMDMLYYLQMLSCDIAYKKYMDIREYIAKNKPSVLEFFEEEHKKANDAVLKKLEELNNKEN